MTSSQPHRSVDDLFTQLLSLQAERTQPPVHLWHPERQGEIDIRIASDGAWWHEGGEIRRPELVRLFASILRLDDDGYCLVTPAERLRIEVDDAPFVAVDLDVRNPGMPDQSMLFTTNVEEYVLLDADHPLAVVEKSTGPHPYIDVRSGLRALLSRSVFYRLVELGEELPGADLAGKLWVRSSGQRYCLGSL